MHTRMRREKLHCVIDAHHQDFADALVFEFHSKRVRIEAQTSAAVADHAYIRQETHLDFAQSLPLALFASSTRRVERETRRVITAHPRLRCLREGLSYRVPKADVRSRAGARCFADRCLIHFEYAVDLLPTLHLFAAVPTNFATTARANCVAH